MIGFLSGKVKLSNGHTTLLEMPNGIGYEFFFSEIVSEGNSLEVFISHQIKEGYQALFGFRHHHDKKFFDLLLKVKGVGPKSAYSLISFLGVESLIKAITLDDKKTIQKTPGVGAKVAAQVILDLQSHIKDFQNQMAITSLESKDSKNTLNLNRTVNNYSIVDEALLAFKELGFPEANVYPIIKKVMQTYNYEKSELLVEQVLKEI
jgi:Holliday junction DNA helicase RuvA